MLEASAAIVSRQYYLRARQTPRTAFAQADDRRKAEPYCRHPLGGYGFALSPLSLDRQRWLMGLFLSLPDC